MFAGAGWMGSWSSVRRGLGPAALAVTLAAALGAEAAHAELNAPTAMPAGIASPFVDSWRSLDGGASLGAPVSSPVDIDGALTQFFAYGALQQQGDGKVVRYQVGSALAAAEHHPERTVNGRRVGSDRGAAAFTSTGTSFAIADAIADDYEALGGADRFGRPISGAYTTGGKRVQWFEYGRIVWTPEQGGGVQALDGWDLARALDIPITNTVSTVLPQLPAAIDNDAQTVAAGDGFNPARIEIPSIGVDASVEDIGIVDGVMQTPENAWNVGWYDTLSSPGAPGNAVFAAHRDWWGVGPVVFYNLDQVAPGDQIVVTGENGESATYVVTDVSSIDATADFTSVISPHGGEEITLITCSGNFDGSEYLDRLIVRGVLVA
jgi:LPXTG-site transpeptidase (sortase) family protein